LTIFKQLHKEGSKTNWIFKIQRTKSSWRYEP